MGKPLVRRRMLWRGPVGAMALLLLAAGGVASGAAATVPVVVIVMENHTYQSLVGNANAPFINKTMIPGGTLDTHYFAEVGSLPDYLIMVAGSRAPAASAPNLFSRLGASTPWTEFMESAPSVCYEGATSGKVHGTSVGLYTRYHNPAIQFTAVSGSALCQNIVPLDTTHFDPAALLAFSFMVPNECNDMETRPTNNLCPMWNGTTNQASNTVKMGDNWLASIVPQLAKYATVIVTWDEGAPSNEQIMTLTYGVGVSAAKDATSYTHSSLEAGLYAYFRLGTAPGSGATAKPLPIP